MLLSVAEALPAARFFGLLHRNFYKAEPVEGLHYTSFVGIGCNLYAVALGDRDYKILGFVEGSRIVRFGVVIIILVIPLAKNTRYW